MTKRLVALLSEHKKTISCAESLTGGMLASSIVDISGASGVFAGGVVTYTDEIKHSLLGVRLDTLKEHTAVSGETVCEMAIGCRNKLSTDFAISTSGYAGPLPNEDGTPIGRVYIGFASEGITKSYKCDFSGDRGEIRRKAAEKAIEIALENITAIIQSEVDL